MSNLLSKLKVIVKAGGDFLQHEKFLKKSRVHQLSADDGNGKRVKEYCAVCQSTLRMFLITLRPIAMKFRHRPHLVAMCEPNLL
jgi:hypothetical protein